jgi:hypothetical protein
MVDKFDKSKGRLIQTNGLVRAPQGMHRYAWAKTTIQIHGIALFEFN